MEEPSNKRRRRTWAGAKWMKSGTLLSEPRIGNEDKPRRITQYVSEATQPHLLGSFVRKCRLGLTRSHDMEVLMGFLDFLLKKKRSNKRDSGKQLIDVRSGEERRLEEEAAAVAKTRARPEIEALFSELLRIGSAEQFLKYDSSGKYDDRGNHLRTYAIGQELNRLGGMKLMLAGFYRVRVSLPAVRAAELERTWDGIGDWQA